MERRTPIAWAALALSGAAVVLAAYAVLRPQNDNTEYAQLHERLEALEAREVPGRQRPVAAVRHIGAADGAPPEDRAEADAEALPTRTAPEYVQIDPGIAGVTVHQGPTGALSVTNENPEIVGQVYLVAATTADGTVTQIPITMPPPE